MSEFNVTVTGGTSVRLPTAGKYCDRDILVTATGGGGTTPANPVIESLSVTENGTYTAPNGVDGYSPVEVNVPVPDGYIMPSGIKNITENGTHDAREYEKVAVNVPIPDGYIVPSGTKSIAENGTHDVKTFESVSVDVPIPEGYIQPSGTMPISTNGKHTVTSYDEVDVNVPIPDGYIQPSGFIQITSNGTYDVTEKASAVVSIPEREIVLQNKTIVTNGTYSADAGYDGLGQVVVSVPSSGGGSEDLNAVLTEQEALIAELQELLSNKMFGGNSELPDGYSQIDFIEFNGEQLIDTKIIGNQDTRIRSRFTWGNATQNHLFGCASPDNTASITSYMNGSWRFGAKSETKNVAKNNTLLPYEVYVDKTMIGITGGNTAISDVADFETIGTLLLGGARSSSGGLPGSGLVGRVFYFKVWDGETLILDLIPVTNGTIYRFWDKVSKIFFDTIDDTPLAGGNL